MSFQDKYGKWAIVAGGSDGIGAAFVRELARRGLNVIAVARNQGTLDALAAQIGTEYPAVEIRPLAVDLSREEAAAEVFTATEGLDVGCLVYNVGSEPAYGDFLGHEWDFIHGRLFRNFVTKTALTHHYAGVMAQRGKGAIVLMGSMSGYFGNPGFSLYSASKAFTRYLSEGLWYEFRKRGVDLICPVVGPTDTPTMAKAYGKLENAMKPEDVAISALEAVGTAPIWIAPDIAEQIRTMEAMAPAERATLSAKWAEDFVVHGKKPSLEGV